MCFREGDRREAEQWLDRTTILFDRASNKDSNGGLIVDNVDNGAEVILFILLKIGNFGATLALPGDDFLDPSRVETIDKRLIFGIDTTTNRLSAMRAFQSSFARAVFINECARN